MVYVSKNILYCLLCVAAILIASTVYQTGYELGKIETLKRAKMVESYAILLEKENSRLNSEVRRLRKKHGEICEKTKKKSN